MTKKLFIIIFILLLPAMCFARASGGAFGTGNPGVKNPATEDWDANGKNVTGVNTLSSQSQSANTYQSTANDGQHFSNPSNLGWPDAGILSDGAFSTNRTLEGLVYQKSGTERAYKSLAYEEILPLISPTAIYWTGQRNIYIPIDEITYPKGVTLTTARVTFAPNIKTPSVCPNVRRIYISKTFGNFTTETAVSKVVLDKTDYAGNTLTMTSWIKAGQWIKVSIPPKITWTYNMTVRLLGWGRGY